MIDTCYIPNYIIAFGTYFFAMQPFNLISFTYFLKFEISLLFTLAFVMAGIEVVKEGIRKLKFTQQLKKSESGAKTRKVELTISADGVAIQEPRTHVILHQFPLHRISYCADDKGEKKFFSFIAKQPNQGKSATPRNFPHPHLI